MHTEHPPIVRRRVDIAFTQNNDQAWLGLKYGIESFMNSLSYTFAPSEKFFIRSVQHYQERLSDPALKEEVANFIYQEAMHTKQHNKCNHALTYSQPHGPKITQSVASIFGFMQRFSPKATQLAFTIAMEHFYAILSDFLLTYQEEFIQISDPAFSTLWLWHAVEETEHKAVCFDVYQHIHGNGPLSYLNRVFGMFLATLYFMVSIPVSLFLVRKNVRPMRPAPAVKWSQVATPQTREMYKQHGVWGFVRRSFPLKAYFSFYKPSFHPWDHDNRHLIKAWKERFADMAINGKS